MTRRDRHLSGPGPSPGNEFFPSERMHQPAGERDGKQTKSYVCLEYL